MDCSFINQNSQKWIDEASAAGGSVPSADDGEGDGNSSICIDGLYSTNAEERKEELRRIIYLLRSDMVDADTDTNKATKHTKTLEIVAGNNQLLSALARMLREDCVSSELCQIFFHLSLFPAYHPLLLSHGIGSLLMDYLIRKFKQARTTCSISNAGGEDVVNGEETRDDQSVSLDAGVADDVHNDTDVNAVTCGSRNSSRSTAPSPSSYRRTSHPFGSNQEQLINLCLTILDNLADDLDVRRKMFKSGQLLTPLLACLDCQTTGCVKRSLLLLRKASMFEEVVAELSQNDGKYLRAIIHVAIERSTDADAVANEENAIIVDHAIRLLFNASFHKECRKTMADTQALIDLLVVLTSVARNENSPSRQVCTNLLKVLCMEMVDSCCEVSNQLCLDE